MADIQPVGMTAETAGRVVAWQYRVFSADEGWGLWEDCDKATFEMMSSPHYAGKAETRALVPEQLLVEEERKVEAVSAVCEETIELLRQAEFKLQSVRALADELAVVVIKHGVPLQDNRYIAKRLRALTETPSEETR
jgi:hypothetical protein